MSESDIRLRVLRKHCLQAALAEICQILPGATLVLGVCLGIGLAAVLHRLPGVLATIGRILVFVVGVGVVRESASQWFRLRDKLTARLNQRESPCDESGLILYLHSFSDVTSQVLQYHERPTAHGTTYGPLPYFSESNVKGTDPGRRIHHHLLWDIEDAVIGLGRLVQVGGPNVHKRASSLIRLDVNDWRPVMQRAARMSRLIVVVPGTSEGLMEELTILRDDGLFPKTVVVMQPERSDQEGTQHSRSWEFYRTKLVSMGFNLPAYQRKGLAYLPGEDLSARTLLADDLTGEFSESLRGAVVAALERRRSFVPVRVALPAILSGEAVATREVENARVEEHFAETLRRPRSGVLPTLVTLYADPANALARYRMLSNLQRAAVVVSAIVAVLSLVAVLERTGTMHYWYESIRLIAFAAVSSVGFFIFGIIVAAVLREASIIGVFAMFLCPSMFWLLCMVSIGRIPATLAGGVFSWSVGWMLGVMISMGVTFKSLRGFVNVLRLTMTFVFGLGGPLGLAVQVVNNGFLSALPGLAFGVALILGLCRPFNLIAHAAVLALPTRLAFLKFHPALWDRVCPLQYWGLEYALARVAIRDWLSGLQAIHVVGEHPPLRRAAARAEQAVYVARSSEPVG